jgi:acetylornithine/N-succinyldiaminopimelate aminotransferase
LICAAALQVLTVIEKRGLLENVRERGTQLRAGLEKLKGRFDFVREIRGEGLIVGVDLSIDGSPVVVEALRQGLIVNCTHEHIIRLLPAFIVTRAEVAEFLSKFEHVLQTVSTASGSTSSSPKTKSETHQQPASAAAAR